MALHFSEDVFVEVISSDMFDNCLSQYGDFAYEIFAKLIESEENQEKKEVLRIISDFCSMYMKDDKNEPFGPMFTGHGKRSFLPEDISKDLAQIIYNNVDKVNNIAIQARLCDVLWVIKLLDNKDNINCAKKAVECYYQLIDQFIVDKNFYAACNYLDRVYNLTMRMPGTPERKELFGKLLKYAEIEYTYTDASSMYWYGILEKIAGFGIKHTDVIIQYYNKTLQIIRNLLHQDFYVFPNDVFYGSKKMQEITANAQKNSDLIWTRKLYDVAIKFAETVDKNHVDDLMVSKAKTFEYEAQQKPHMNNFSHWLKEAIYIYRNLSNHKSDVDRLTKEIEQNTISMPYATFSHGVDVTEFVKMAQENVAGKDFVNAIFSLTALFGTFFGGSLDKDKAKERCLSLQKQSPLFNLFAQVIVDENGHTISTASTKEELLNLDMMRNLWLENEISYVGIREAINVINMEHHYEYRDILKLMDATPFVPDRHKVIMAKGINAFLHGEMMEGAHFLILQFEDCLRYLLEPIETTMIIVDNHSEEKNTSIDSLLNKCVENNILPDGLAWLFKTYLVEKSKNVRNGIAHGFIQDKYYYSIDVQIVCYAIMYLVFFHVASSYFKSKTNEN